MLIVCTSCQGRMRVPEGLAGKKGKCPKCGAILTIAPAEAHATPTPSPVGAALPEQPPTEAQVPAAAPSEQATIAAPSATPGTDTPMPGLADAAPTGSAYAFLAPPQAAGELGRLGPYRVLQRARPGRHGHRLRRRGPQARPAGRAQGDAAGDGQQARRPRPLPAQGARGGTDRARPHRRHLRGR